MRMNKDRTSKSKVKRQFSKFQTPQPIDPACALNPSTLHPLSRCIGHTSPLNPDHGIILFSAFCTPRLHYNR